MNAQLLISVPLCATIELVSLEKSTSENAMPPWALYAIVLFSIKAPPPTRIAVPREALEVLPLTVLFNSE